MWSNDPRLVIRSIGYVIARVTVYSKILIDHLAGTGFYGQRKSSGGQFCLGLCDVGADQDG